MFLIGVLAIDESFKGMGVTAYIPCLNIEWSKCYDIRYHIKTYDRPTKIIEHVYKWITQELLIDLPCIKYFINHVVIESQFHTKMKLLQMTVANQLHVILRAKISFISALTVKKYFEIPLCKSHYENKKAMLKYIKDHSLNLLAGTTHQENDNIADSIAILNTFIKRQKKIEMPEPPEYCPLCNDTEKTVWHNISNTEKNPGRSYYRCNNDQCGAFKWDVPFDPNKDAGLCKLNRKTGKKRTNRYTPKEEPARKRTKYNNEERIDAIYDILVQISGEVDEIKRDVNLIKGNTTLFNDDKQLFDIPELK